MNHLCTSEIGERQQHDGRTMPCAIFAPPVQHRQHFVPALSDFNRSVQSAIFQLGKEDSKVSNTASSRSIWRWRSAGSIKLAWKLLRASW